MAESPSSTSEKPPIEKVGLGFLLDDAPPSDPIEPPPEILEIQHSEPPENAPDGGETDHPTAVMAEVVVGEAAAHDAYDEEVEFRNAIERDLFELTIQQAEIDRAFEILESAEEGKGDYFVTVEKGDEDGKYSESVDDANEIEIDGDVGSKSADGEMKLGRFNQSNNRKRVNYPMRTDAEDCAFYMKFGSCKFGLNCKFNHPPRRKNQVCLHSWIDHANNV